MFSLIILIIFTTYVKPDDTYVMSGINQRAARGQVPGRYWLPGDRYLADTCGGLIGASLVLGLVNKDKAKSMKQMRHIMTKFQERNGATQCKLLKGVGTKVVLRECPDCVADAAEFLEEQLNG